MNFQKKNASPNSPKQHPRTLTVRRGRSDVALPDGMRSEALFRRRSSGTSTSRTEVCPDRPRAQSPEPQTSAKNTENGTRNQHDARSRRSNRTHRLPRNPHGAARSTGAVAWRGEIAATVHCCHRQERKGKRTTISGGLLGVV